MDFLREAQWLAWVAAAIVLGLIEIASLDFIFSMLAIAALATAGVAFMGGNFLAQVITFAAASTITLLVLRPIAKRRMQRIAPERPTNAAALRGKVARVEQEVTDTSGRVKLDGEIWTARPAHEGGQFAVGDTVRVVAIDGATARIAPRTESTTPAE